MEIIAFFLWLFGASPNHSPTYFEAHYDCTTDYDCQLQCEQQGGTDCEY